jgi:hypothetical protein
MMSTTKDQVRSTEEALDLALEALEPFTTPNWAGTGVDKANEAVTAIKQARSAPVKDNSNYRLDPPGLDPAGGTQVSKVWWDGEKLMAKPIPFVEFFKAASTTQREWVGLTDEQIDLFINGRGDEDDDDYVEPTGDGFGITDADLVKLVRRAEAKLKEKNNG